MKISRSERRAAERERILTPNEVAERLLVAPVTVRLWASFRVEDVDAFIQRRQQVQGAAHSPPSRLLIIDDDAQFARYLSNLLASRAPWLTVEVALDGFLAGIKCESLRPDIVTLDLHMPDMDGFEVCRLLRQKFAAQRLRIVALSGFASGENVKRVLEAGADSCVPKTTPADQLIRELGLAARAPPQPEL
jgi:CheY-like chemotaxis protein